MKILYNKISESIKVRNTYIGMSVFDEPFIALFSLLSFILAIDLNATPFQVAVLVSLRPIVSLFTFYWSANLKRQEDKLVTNLMGAWFIGRVPFLFMPFFTSVWSIIFAVGVFHLFSRASTPALMEILRQNFEKQEREKLVSRVYLLKFIESGIFAVVFGSMLDLSPSIWKWLIACFALLSISTLILQRRIKINPTAPVASVPKGFNRVTQPWKDSFELLAKRKDFARFQMGFMIGGFALMMVSAVLPYYFKGLCLTHETICYGKNLWMGVGVFASTFIWQRILNHYSIEKVMSLMLLGFFCFPLTLILASSSFSFFYIAFFCYGFCQAGSHLLWNLSGPYFSNQEESSSFTTVNIHMIGLRGLIAPFLGVYLYNQLGAQITLIISSIICLIGAGYMFVSKKSVIKKTA